MDPLTRNTKNFIVKIYLSKYAIRWTRGLVDILSSEQNANSRLQRYTLILLEYR